MLRTKKLCKLQVGSCNVGEAECVTGAVPAAASSSSKQQQYHPED